MVGGRYAAELAEVEEEIRAAEEAMEQDFSASRGGVVGGGGDAASTSNSTAALVNSPAAVAARQRVQDELGDLVFDVLMLGAMCERRFGSGCAGVAGGTGVSLAGAAAGAAAKVKRRCPYTFGGGMGRGIGDDDEDLLVTRGGLIKSRVQCITYWLCVIVRCL